MKKSIIVFLISILIFSVNLAGADSTDTSRKCLAGTTYLMSLCFLADGDGNKLLDLMYLYGIPCLFFNGIWGDDEISMPKCLVGYFYILNVCVACDGDVLKCIGLASSTYYLPCMYLALRTCNDCVANE
jgi:hypothetical protein